MYDDDDDDDDDDVLCSLLYFLAKTCLFTHELFVRSSISTKASSKLFMIEIKDRDKKKTKKKRPTREGEEKKVGEVGGRKRKS